MHKNIKNIYNKKYIPPYPYPNFLRIAVPYQYPYPCFIALGAFPFIILVDLQSPPPTSFGNANFGPLAMPEVMDIVLNDLKELDQDDEAPSYVPAFQLESH